jgi:hypothetical protein
MLIRALLVRILLVRLLAALAREERPTTAKEERLYQLGIRALARYGGQSVEAITRMLLEDVRRGFIVVRRDDY